jgi:hypothetical protein
MAPIPVTSTRSSERRLLSQGSFASRLIVNFKTYLFGILVRERFTLLTIPLLSVFPAR